MSADAMTPNQKTRAEELIERARKALLLCSGEDLNLNPDSRAALAKACDAVDEFRLYVQDQPTEGQLL